MEYNLYYNMGPPEAVDREFVYIEFCFCFPPTEPPARSDEPPLAAPERVCVWGVGVGSMGVGVVGEGELRRSHKPTRERFAGRGHPSPAPRNVPEFADTKRIELQCTHLTCNTYATLVLTLHSLWLPAIVAPKAKIEKMTFQKCYKVLQNGKMTSQKYCKVCKNAN